MLCCWLAKKAQPRQRKFGWRCWAVVLCPGLRLQEGVKGKDKRPRGDGPLANIRVGGQWGDGRDSSLAQGSMQNRRPKGNPGSGAAVTARVSLMWAGPYVGGAPPSAKQFSANQPKQTIHEL